ncbi:MAG: integrase core domain-containing protein [Negativicutes bacterium]
MVKRCLSRMSGKLSCTVLRRGEGSNPFSLVDFSSIAYINCIKSLETVRISMDGRGRATDNIMIERFFRSFKWKRLYLLRPETIREVKEMTVEYLDHYNYGRPHQGLGEVTPGSIYFQQDRTAA